MVPLLKTLAWIGVVVGVLAPILGIVKNDPSGLLAGLASLGSALTLFVIARFLSLVERIAVGIEKGQKGVPPASSSEHSITSPGNGVNSADQSNPSPQDVEWGRHPI